MLGSQADILNPIIHRRLGQLQLQLILAYCLFEAAHEACRQIGGDLGHGNFRICRAQNVIGQIGTVHTRQVADTAIHIGQMAPHGQSIFRCRRTASIRCVLAGSRKLHLCQIGHNIVRCHIDAVLEAVGHHRAIRLGGRNQVAHFNRRLLGLDLKGAVVLPEPIIRVLQAHQIIQLLHGCVPVAAVVIDHSGLRSHLSLAGDHIRQEEKAHHIGGCSPAFVLQRLLHNIAGVQEAAAAGTAGNAGENIHIQIGTIHPLQRLRTLGLNGRLQRTRLGNQQIAAHLADATGSIIAQQIVDLINVHPVHGSIALDLVLGLQHRRQIGVIDGEKLLIPVQFGLAAHPVDIGGVRIDGQKLDVLIRGNRRIRIIRLQLLIHLLFQLRQRRHTGAADADGQCRRTAILLGLLAVVDNTAAAVQ